MDKSDDMATGGAVILAVVFLIWLSRETKKPEYHKPVHPVQTEQPQHEHRSVPVPKDFVFANGSWYYHVPEITKSFEIGGVKYQLYEPENPYFVIVKDHKELKSANPKPALSGNGSPTQPKFQNQGQSQGYA